MTQAAQISTVEETDWPRIAGRLARDLRSLKQAISETKLVTSPVGRDGGLDIRIVGLPNINSEQWRCYSLNDYEMALEQEPSPLEKAFAGQNQLLTRVVELEYNGGDNRPLKDVAEELGISVSWARRLRKKAYELLREYFRHDIPFHHGQFIGRILYNAPANGG